MNEGEKRAFIELAQERQDEFDYNNMVSTLSAEITEHLFCIFKNGKETIVSLSSKEYFARYNYGMKTPHLTPRARVLQKMQEKYLYNKKKQEDQKFTEAACFRFWATKRLPLTRDVVNLICSIITNRPYDPKIAVELPSVEKTIEEEVEQPGWTWTDPHAGMTYNVKIRNVTFVNK